MDTPDLDSSAIDHLTRVLSFRTVSAYPGPESPDEFTGLLDYLASTYPNLFSKASVVREGPWRLTLEVPGRDESSEPILLLAHYDVVGVEDGTEKTWTHPPFSGVVANGQVWGRGALDDKGALVAILEAAEKIVTEGQLERGLVLAFGGDEEIGSVHGAKVTAREFRDAGRRFHFILDEGLAITQGIMDHVSRPIAMIGLAEKGLVNVQLSAEGTGGHAGRPPDHTALGTLSKGIVRVESHPFPPRLIRSVESFFRSIGRASSGPVGIVYRHPRLFWPLIRGILSSGAGTNAIIRTSQAVTMASGSGAPNVLPPAATCTINVRVLPGDTVAGVIQHYERLLQGSGITVGITHPDDVHEPASETSADHPGYRSAARAMELADPSAVVTPFIVTDSTDSKYYASLSDAVLRFVPMTVTKGDLASIHGTNEHLSLESFSRMIRFYFELMKEVCLHGRSRG